MIESGTRLRRVTVDEAMKSARTFELPDVAAIIDAVRREGDRAVARYAAAFGDAPPRRVAAREMHAAFDALDDRSRTALEGAAARIEAFAREQRATLYDLSVEMPWGTIGHRLVPVESAGAYVPAGGYPLPSSLLMTVLPARVAGVERIAVCTPRIADATLAAAYVAGVEELYEVGGAQAIAALAFGTELIAAVDLIVGPGNAYVAAAKRAVSGHCGIEAVAGPSEVLIVAGDDANPAFVASDLLAQAEHDSNARAMLLCESDRFAREVDAWIERLLPELSTHRAAAVALKAQGWCCVSGVERAVEIANTIAPEHLELHGEAVEQRACEFRSYGALFLGSNSAEALGDYGCGPNHVLPTNGTARYSSGLSVFSFLTVRTFQRVRRVDAALFDEAETLARMEGLTAHARAIRIRGGSR